MKHSLLNVAGVTALAAGMAFGQSAPTQNPPAQNAPGRHSGRGQMFGRLGADLNLTDAQKEQARSIFSAARQSAQPVHDQVKQARRALAAAVKSGASDAEIDRLSNNLAPLMAQSTAIHTKAFAKFYGTLTQEQKDKLGDRFNMMMNGFQGRWRGAQRSSSQSDQPHSWRKAEN